MATHRRKEITIETVNLLNQQSTLWMTIIVSDSQIERNIAETVSGYFVEHPNRPLSNKWQAGISAAKEFEPDAILICGSDDWLTTNWCETCHEYIADGYDLVGQNAFYICNVVHGQVVEVIKRSYFRPGQIHQPFGSGRLISRNILEALNWQLYPPDINGTLDGMSYNRIVERKGRVKLLNDHNDLKVLLVKGSWECLDSWNQLKNTSSLKTCHDSQLSDPLQWIERYFNKTPGDLQNLA